MIARLILALALAVVLAPPALAESPDGSPRPAPRPASAGSVPEGADLGVAATGPEVARAALAAITAPVIAAPASGDLSRDEPATEAASTATAIAVPASGDFARDNSAAEAASPATAVAAAAATGALATGTLATGASATAASAAQAAPAIRAADAADPRPRARPDTAATAAQAATVIVATADAADAADPRPRARPAALVIAASATAAPAAAAPATAAIVPAVFAATGTSAPLSVPLPQPRPASVTPDVVFSVTSVSAPLKTTLRPLERPEALETEIRVAVFRTQPAPEATFGKKGSVCGNPAIKGSKISPIKARITGCGLKDGVSVTSVSGVALSTPAAIDCTTAEALNRWVAEAVTPAVGETGGGVAALEVAASYACRPRNNQRGAKISEHGRGRAVDISAIVLADGSAITVAGDWGSGRQGKVLKAVHRAACGPFTTVLGPAADRHHHDHLHLDTAPGRGPYCR